MKSFGGTKMLQSFAPGWGDAELLEKTLVGRRPLVDRLEELAIDGAGGPNKHQRLIVGVRGSGKTHVLRVLHNRLWRNEDLKERLLIVYLLEDELGVASLLDFVVRVLRAIVRWYPKERRLIKELNQLPGLPLSAQKHYAVKLLLEAAGAKDVLIITENLGVIFGKKSGFGLRGQQAFRDLVQQHPRFMIFASSQALVEGIRRRDAPFFGFFKVIHLQRLEVEEAMNFLMAMASAAENDHLIAFLSSSRGRGRMRAIYQFTGGNHRLLVTFYEFLTADSLVKLSELFIRSLNPLRPYYQEQMRSLSAQQQKIIQYLSLERTPRSVKHIARGCLVAPNILSSQLKGLLDRNFVNRIRRGRESYYEVTEALFRICYEADLEQEGAPVRLFVDFLGNLYSAKELRLRQRGFVIFASRLGNKGKIPFAEEAQLYSEAIRLHYPEPTTELQPSTNEESPEKEQLRSFFEDLEEASAYREVLEFAGHLGERRDAFVLHTEANAYAHLGDREGATASAQNALQKDPKDKDAHLLLADLFSKDPPSMTDALEHAQRAHALAPDDPETLEMMGITVGRGGDHSGALKLFEKLTGDHPDRAKGWRLAGDALYNLDRLDEAETMYRKAIELDPENADALESLGILLGTTGKHEETFEQFEALNTALPDHSRGWWLTGRALINLDRLDEAKTMYRKAIELDPGSGDALESLGVLLGTTGKYEEALEQFEAVNAARPDYSQGWWLTGRALVNLDRLDEAKTMYRKAIELDPENADALESLGVLVFTAGKHEEALEQFEALNAALPDHSRGWWLTGKALYNLDRLDEAKTMYRKAIELDPGSGDALESLGVLLGTTGKYEEALEQFEALNAALPDHSRGWWLTGKALDNLDRLDEAKTMYRKAIELDPGSGDALESLGVLLGTTGKYEEALEQFEAVNAARPDYSQGWWLTGKALDNLDRLDEAETMYRKAIDLDPGSGDALESLGVLLGTTGKYEEALEQFEAVNAARPDYSQGWWLTGRALVNLDRLDEAKTMYRKAIELDPENADALESLGVLVFTAGKHEEALEQFEALNTALPDHSRGWWLTGRALVNLDRLDEAKTMYRKAIELDPENADALESLGILLGTAGKHEEALEQFEALNTALPDHSRGWWLTGKALYNLDRLDEAKTMYRKAIELDPGSGDALESLGVLLGTTGKYEEALEQFEAVNAAAPDYSHGWWLTGRALDRLDRPEEAEAPYRKAIELDPKNAKALESLGRLVGNAGRHEEALKLFEAVNAERPDYSRGWWLTGRALDELDRPKEAEAPYRKAIELDPEDMDALLSLGMQVFNAEKHEEALKLFEAVNAAAPDYSRGWWLTGKALDELDQRDEAEARYRKAIELDPENTDAWLALARMLWELGREEEASEPFDKAVKLGASRARLLNARGEARRGRGEYRLAIEDYEEALLADPDLPLPHLNITSSLLALGRTEEAIHQFSLAIEANMKDLEPGLFAQLIHENCMALFEYASPDRFGWFLSAMLDTLDTAGHLGRFEESLPMTVFALLSDHEKISQDRFQQIVSSLQEAAANRVNVSVATRFLRVGINHFKKHDRKAILSLSSEERRTFCRELGISEQNT